MNTDNTLHIYTRVSSTAQMEDGTSLHTQKQDGIRKASELGMEHKVWNEGGQSSNHDDLDNRPVLTDLLTQIEDGQVKHLFVYNTDRLSRNQRTWGMIRWKLQSNNVVLHTPTGRIDLSNPLDDLLMGLLSEISQYDNKIRAERSRKGKLQKVQDGYFHGGPTPFGYKNINKKLVIDKYESKWVKTMYEMYMSGHSVDEIRSHLNKHSVPTRRNKPSWALGSINLILRNPLYTGEYQYTDKKLNQTVKVQVPQIIDKATWSSVRNKVTRFLERKHQINRSKHDYLLRDFMVCGHCGQKMSARKGPNQHFYFCPSKERNFAKNDRGNTKVLTGKGCSMNRSLNIDRTDEVVWSTIVKLVSESKTLRESYRKDILAHLNEIRASGDKELASLHKQRKRLNKESSSISKAITDLSTSLLLKRHVGNADELLSSLEGELDLVKSKLSDLDLKESQIANSHQWVNWLDQYEEMILSKNQLTEKEKKVFLEGVVDKISVFFDKDLNEHSLDIKFSLPIIGDRLNYRNPERPSDGWVVSDGDFNHPITNLPISRGGRPKSHE